MNSRSLLDYLDAPVLVGDPDGRVVHLNPSFESRFEISLDQARGEELATLFEGGAREAVLTAVADDNRVGVVILITAELSSDRRMIECAKDIQEPLEELTRCLGEFADQVGGRRAERYRLMLEDVAGAIELLRKRADELQSLLSGTSAINP
jgi:PAS domain-containing protein